MIVTGKWERNTTEGGKDRRWKRLQRRLEISGERSRMKWLFSKN